MTTIVISTSSSVTATAVVAQPAMTAASRIMRKSGQVAFAAKRTWRSMPRVKQTSSAMVAAAAACPRIATSGRATSTFMDTNCRRPLYFSSCGRTSTVLESKLESSEESDALSTSFAPSETASSYEDDEEAEDGPMNTDGHAHVVATTPLATQHLPTDLGPNGLNDKETTMNSAAARYHDVLQAVGLEGELSELANLPVKRPLSNRDVFCNRELKLSGIRAIGFDMDYTLAQYKQPAFDKLAFDGAKDKLFYSKGYPKEVLDFTYDHTRWVRGLVIDTQRGNFLKIDRHKYVRVAYHGFQRISKTTRKHLYSRTFNKVVSFGEKHFVNMDTLFQHVDAHLFASLIEMKDNGEFPFLDFKTYEEMYADVRSCVDLCHRDGVIKDEVGRNPDKYIISDNGLVPMLESYREQGVKVFLLTNSYWEYTSVAMNYLYHQRDVEPELKKKNEWMKLFDIIIVGSCKPAYLLDPYLNLFRVRPEDGSLLNTDGLFEIEALGENGAQKYLALGKTFQGGNWKHLCGMLEIEAGEEILYVGDHLYADVLRSKRTLGWRSAFIMPELEEEMRVFHEQVPLAKQIGELRQLRDELSVYGDYLYQKLAKKNGNNDEENDDETWQAVARLQEDDTKLKKALIQMTDRYHSAFHDVWGQMFQAGYQGSRFAYFVQNYACLYTSRATNLGLASPSLRSFRTTSELLPQDKLMAETNHVEYTGDDDPWGDDDD